jgi:hypothetical protein
MSKKFNFKYVVDVDLTANEIWSDGDAPANPTIEDVANVVKKHRFGYVLRNGTAIVVSDSHAKDMLDEWNLDIDAELVITESKEL